MSDSIIEIPRELFAIAGSSSFEGRLDPQTIDAGPDSYVFDEPLAWQVDISNTGDALLVDGRVEGRGRTRCARCLDDMSIEVKGHVEGYFVLPEADEPEDRDDDEFERLPDSNTIDVEPLCRAAVLVEMPLVPLCREDCKGLCPDCGINLNEETCGCAAKRAAELAEEEDRLNPFAALKGLDLED